MILEQLEIGRHKGELWAKLHILYKKPTKVDEHKYKMENCTVFRKKWENLGTWGKAKMYLDLTKKYDL